TMKVGVGLFPSLLLFLLMGEVFAQRPRPKKPTRRPATTRKPFVPKRVVPVFEKIPGLLYFYAQRNQLNEVPSGLPTSLEQLRLDRNRISKIPAGAFTKLENLTLLDLHYNQVNHI
ncbi:hypothetical protein XENOCAPTIV_001120, partial [Xenoophorus captivus]